MRGRETKLRKHKEGKGKKKNHKVGGGRNKAMLICDPHSYTLPCTLTVISIYKKFEAGFSEFFLMANVSPTDTKWEKYFSK